MIELEEDMAGICSWRAYFRQNFIKFTTIYFSLFQLATTFETCQLLTPVVVQPCSRVLRPSSWFLPHSLLTMLKHASLPGMILIRSSGPQSVEAHTFVVLETMAK